MKSFKATSLFFKHKTWPEFKFLFSECFFNFKEAFWGLVFLLVCPIIIPFKFTRNFLEFRSLDEDVLNKFFEDPKRYSEKIGENKKHQL